MKKICIKCGIEKDESDFYFRKDRNIYRRECKKCHYIKEKEWITKNLEKSRGYKRKWKKENSYYEKEYVKNNPEKIRGYKRKWEKNNPEKLKEKDRIWKKNNPEKVKASNKKYRKNHPERSRKDGRKRRNLKLNVEGSHTEKEWKNKKKEYNYRCAYCGIHENVLKNKYLDKKGNIQLEKSFWKLTEDHIIALSKGGSDYITNIVPACWSCNASKRNKDISKWFISKHDIPHT